MKTLLLMLTVALPLTAQAAQPAGCAPATSADIAALFDRWNTSLQTGQPSQVAANYADVSILLPTLSNKPRLTQAERIDYFEHFLQARPTGRIDSRFIEVGCNYALDSGLYTFTYGNGKQVQARYTFTYAWDGRQWLISSHHSSQMPE